ncbi:flagellar motor switch protein FliG [Methylosinus sp. Sm6]|uniref:flagellar motor switch protein FliG n=1 Tax=Methylosinus sp. Sm6 TaxID=2866948 RepID=UPI002102B08E|nr:FliG C-terminal domain-containing protein [Methylosinus sp. Sm6]
MITEPTRVLNGPEKVAALLLSVDKFVAQRVLKHFDQNELRQITKFAAGLGSVPASAIEPLIDEFMNELANGGGDLRGTAGEAEQLITGVVSPEQVAEIMSEVRGSPNGLVWERVGSAPEGAFTEYVGKEHPQTAALMLSRVDPARAAKTLGALPQAFRDEVVRRMLATRTVADEMLRLLETVLQAELLQNSELTASAAKNAKLASIINKMERDQAEGALRSLSERRPRDAEALKSMLFTFEDVTRLNVRARMILFDTVPSDRVVLALRGADVDIRDFILAALSSRMRRMVESELSTGASPPRRDILEARRLIADTVLKLAEQGKIDLSSPAEGEPE